MNKNNNLALLGNGAGLISGITWAMNTVLIGIALTLNPLGSPYMAFFAPFLSNFLNDVFVCFWTFITLVIRGKIKQIIPSFFSRNGVILVIAGILGGPLGMLFYILGVKYSGAAYASIISSTYPVLGAIIARIFLKEKLPMKTYLGLILIIFAVIYIGYKPGSLSIHHPNMALGLVFSFLSALGWGIQGVFLSWGMKKETIAQHMALLITVTSSLIIDLAIILPVVGAIKYVIPVIFSHSGAVAFLAASIGAFSTWIYYVSVHKIGPSRAMGLNITYGVWAVFLQVIFMHNHLNARLLIASIIIVIGVLLGSARKKELTPSLA
ncbi:DMT family transporter [Clostridium thermobutyricum]|uniref:DMT family transporter n=1 Tax=Clostridium thermobutyricum TaxID=29372 RepID=UPI00294204A3|nr:DMT family transporter [Clostridium thermobutyricum]